MNLRASPGPFTAASYGELNPCFSFGVLSGIAESDVSCVVN